MASKKRAAQAASPPKADLPGDAVVEITHSEAAELAGLERATWVSYVSRGQAPQPLRHVGTTPVFDRAVVLKWIAERPGPGYRSDIHGRTTPGVADADTKRRRRAPSENPASSGRAPRARRSSPKQPTKKTPAAGTETVRGRGTAR